MQMKQGFARIEEFSFVLVEAPTNFNSSNCSKAECCSGEDVLADLSVLECFRTVKVSSSGQIVEQLTTCSIKLQNARQVNITEISSRFIFPSRHLSLLPNTLVF